MHDHLELPVVVALLPHDHQVLPDHHLLPLLPVPVQGVVVEIQVLGHRVKLSRHLHQYLLKLARQQFVNRQQLREVVQEIHLPLEFVAEVLMCHSVPQDLRQGQEIAIRLIGEFIELCLVLPCSVFKDDANHLSFSLLYCSVTIRINVRPPPQRPGRSPAAMAAARARSSPARTPT